MCSSVTRPDPSINFQNNYISDKIKLIKDTSISFQNNYVPVKENNSSTMEVVFSVSKLISCVTPDKVYPKAKSRTSEREGRKPPRCRILTDTPEQKHIELQREISLAKRKKK